VVWDGLWHQSDGYRGIRDLVLSFREELLLQPARTEREHGSSYMTIAEWVGLLGVLPFVALLAVDGSERMEGLRVDETNGRSAPLLDSLAMVVLSGPVHANFEDWLFAVGSYLCVFFWVLPFYSRICCLTPWRFQPPLPFPESSARYPPVWSRCAQPMIRLFINGLAASAGGGLTYLRNVIPHLARRVDAETTVLVESGNARGVWKLPNISFVETVGSRRASAFHPGADGVAKADPAERRAGIDFRGQLCALEFSRPANTALPQLALHIRGFLARCSRPRRLRDMGGHLSQGLAGTAIHKPRRNYRRSQ
jgi:hypothetical protein